MATAIQAEQVIKDHITLQVVAAALVQLAEMVDQEALTMQVLVAKEEFQQLQVLQ